MAGVTAVLLFAAPEALDFDLVCRLRPLPELAKLVFVRSVLRALVCLAIGSSIAFAALPGQMPRFEVAKTDCCAKMKAPSGDCEHHRPQPDPEKDCCAACAFGLSAVVAASAIFVYPPTGDETFAAYISSGHFLPHRPPVPPPRA